MGAPRADRATILGVVTRDGSPAGPHLAAMVRAAPGTDASPWNEWADKSAGLAQRVTTSGHRPAEPLESHGVATVAMGRIDNRQDVGDIRRPLARDATGAEVLRSAYRRWETDAPIHLIGDWALAAWDLRRHRLFLARDRFRGTAIYYVDTPRLFAFATSLPALLGLDAVPADPDELFLAQVLISWRSALTDRTVHRHIRLLPPAHSLTVAREGVRLRRYWCMEDVTELRLGSRAEYVEGFREVFDEAVRARLPESGRAGITLSGGLDSSAVAATAAMARPADLGSLVAFTSVPVSDPSAYAGKRFADELELASATANAVGPIELVPVRGTTWSPVEAIRVALEVHNEPIHAAANLYWLLDIIRAARDRGCVTLLTGQMGNAGISWPGDPLSQSLGYQLRTLGARTMAHSWLRRTLPLRLIRAVARRRAAPDWYRTTPINPDFALRLDLLERRLADLEDAPARSALEARLRTLAPRRGHLSACLAESGAAAGVAVRDPTGDARVVSYTLSVPDRVFIDPDSGLDRWLVRDAMKGRVPDEVRLNRRRGLQAGDLVVRLRACRGDVETALDELGAGPAAPYVDVPRMRGVWRTVQSTDTMEAQRDAVGVLMRGLMVGLCVNRIETNQRSSSFL